MKGWNTSGDYDRDIDGNTPKRVLGILWNPREDVLFFNAKLNFSGIRNGQRLEPDLTNNDIPGKIIMRKIWMLKIDWDDVLPTNVRNECLDFFRELLQNPFHKVPKMRETCRCNWEPFTCYIF